MSKEVGLGHLPRRKRPCMYVVENGVLRVLAWFENDATKDEFWQILKNGILIEEESLPETPNV